jgi:ABC-type bacteriocin/lantibiotic exporter with double-glycine peptidase domain
VRLPEVIQSSAMDCGPACLKCVLEGFGIPISYERLREACQTGVDGTSIDALESVARQLGLNAEQIVVPADHVLHPAAENLPAIAVIVLPRGLTHFAVIANAQGEWVQLMDPATGKRRVRKEALLKDLYLHSMKVDTDEWFAWAKSEEFLRVLRARLEACGAGALSLDRFSGEWRALATLDAAARMVQTMIDGGSVRRETENAKLIESLAHSSKNQPGPVIPERFWSALPGNDSQQLTLTGAVVLRFRGKIHQVASSPESAVPHALNRELATAINQKPIRPVRELLALLTRDEKRIAGVLTASIFAAAVYAVLEVVLLRGLVDISQSLTLPSQRLGALSALILLSAMLLVIELPIALGVRRLGRRLEIRLRVAFLEKLPLLKDQYFKSRPISDMAERGHSAHLIRQITPWLSQMGHVLCEFLVMIAGVIYLYPHGIFRAILLAIAALGLPLTLRKPLSELHFRLRTYAGSLGMFHFDALLGLIPVRAHAAERVVRREHELLLDSWRSSAMDVQRMTVLLYGVQGVVCFGLGAWLLSGYLHHAGEAGGALLLVYWILKLPALGQSFAQLTLSYPQFNSVLLRLFELKGAPDSFESNPIRKEDKKGSGVLIRFEDVAVQAAGHPILDGVQLEIPASARVAIVGASGAGKSSLVGLLLGLQSASQGRVLIDGEPLTEESVRRLRADTIWVDPTVQLWNRSLLENLRYGVDPREANALDTVLEQAELLSLLTRLPEGLQTPLGESGSLLSGGEGQRVRFGRALSRPHARLVILDEPFRGLERTRRQALLARAMEQWKGATFICITHDVEETLHFDRVLVVDQGKIAQDGAPTVLKADNDSLYARMLSGEQKLRDTFTTDWRKWRLTERDLHE